MAGLSVGNWRILAASEAHPGRDPGVSLDLVIFH
jgi:hypothetical protein